MKKVWIIYNHYSCKVMLQYGFFTTEKAAQKFLDANLDQTNIYVIEVLKHK